jgi:hypothetical protein
MRNHSRTQFPLSHNSAIGVLRTTASAIQHTLCRQVRYISTTKQPTQHTTDKTVNLSRFTGHFWTIYRAGWAPLPPGEEPPVPIKLKAARVPETKRTFRKREKICPWRASSRDTSISDRSIISYAPYTLSVKRSDFTVRRHTWRKKWVNCIVLTGNSADLRTVLSSRLSHTELRSSLTESYSFLSLPADTTMASSQGTFLL